MRLFDREGRFVRTVGRVGLESNEYQSPTHLALLPNGTLLVYSHPGRKVLAYNPEGGVLWSRTQLSLYAAPISLLRSYASHIVVTSDSAIYVRYYLSPVPGFTRTPLRKEFPSHYARWRLDGTVVDTIIEPFVKDEPPSLTVGPPSDPSNARQVPFTPDFVWTLGRQGYFSTGYPINRGGFYSVELRIPRAPVAADAAKLASWRTGDPVTSIRVPFDPVVISTGERATWETVLTAAFRQRDPAWQWRSAPIPREKPPFTIIWQDEQDRIWVLLHSVATENTAAQPYPFPDGRVDLSYPLSRWPEQQVYDIIEPSGRYLGRIRSSETIYPQQARGDTLWGIVLAKGAGRSAVKRYRIRWGDARE